MHTHFRWGCVTLLADPAISCLLGWFLQWRVQTPKVIAESTLVTPEMQTKGGHTLCPRHLKPEQSFNDEASSTVMDDDKAGVSEWTLLMYSKYPLITPFPWPYTIIVYPVVHISVQINTGLGSASSACTILRSWNISPLVKQKGSNNF